MRPIVTGQWRLLSFSHVNRIQFRFRYRQYDSIQKEFAAKSAANRVTKLQQ